MAKTDLTLAIEQCLLAYDPPKLASKKLNKMRGHTTTLEVTVENGTTAGGIVDAMRLDEYFERVGKEHVCCWKKYKRKNDPVFQNMNLCQDGGVCLNGWTTVADLPPLGTCPQAGCPQNLEMPLFKNRVLITAFEIKTSFADFHSSHGHNFCGNANYYIMPAELYKKVETEIEPWIGVICCHASSSEWGPRYLLRKKRECVFRPMSAEETAWHILSVHKKAMKEQNKKYEALRRRTRQGDV